jgi:hypothetical protein
VGWHKEQLISLYPHLCDKPAIEVTLAG